MVTEAAGSEMLVREFPHLQQGATCVVDSGRTQFEDINWWRVVVRSTLPHTISLCPKGCGGSTPPSRTSVMSLDIEDRCL